MYDIRSAMLNIGIVFTPGKFKINLEKTWKTPGILVNLRSTDPVVNFSPLRAKYAYELLTCMNHVEYIVDKDKEKFLCFEICSKQIIVKLMNR